VKISFHGADRAVTGSCHLVECAGTRALVDCGLTQGAQEAEERNRAPFGFDAAHIDCVLLTHAHLDHCGRLPLLVKRGFRGEIVATAATRELARLVMLDSAHLLEEELHRRPRRAHKHSAPHVWAPAPEPLYSILDTLDCMERFGRTAEYGHALRIGPGMQVRFFDAGHILGSAGLYLELEESGCRRTLAFSGDLGNRGRPLLRAPVLPPPADIAVMETTYGDRVHKPIGPSIEELYNAIDGAFALGGNVVIPTFALERAQEILWCLRRGREAGRLPGLQQVFLDSPMAISATQIFERHPECFDEAVAQCFAQGTDPFALAELVFTRDAGQSEAISRCRGGAVILAGAGMCNGGRVRYHLRQNLGRPECAVIFVGFAAHGTLARRIIDGAANVRIFGATVAVRAAIHTINGFSAHADRDELLDWHRHVRPARTFLVHGEEEVMLAFGPLLRETHVEMPQLGQSFPL
jgi:metallo-beta-lactamase family protein